MSEQVITNLLLGSYFYNFLDFKKKLEQDYGKSVKRIQFKDDEGDFITITSDLELLEARRLGSTVFRIIFEEVSTLEKSSPEVSASCSPSLNQPDSLQTVPVVHSAYCDNCQKIISGIRYKCANCIDYDLCDLCEAENLESDIHDRDHVFLKIYRPVNSNMPMIPTLYKLNENHFISGQTCPRSSGFHSGAVSCPYIKSLEARLEIVEKELEKVQKNLIKNNEQHVYKDKAEKERKQAEKRKEIQLKKQVKQQLRRSKKLLKQQQKIMNKSPSVVLNEKDIVSESVRTEEIFPKESISIPSQEPEPNEEENDSGPKLEDFEDLVQEEKKPIDEQPQPQPEIHPRSQYEEQLCILESMGFVDRNLNESLLGQFKNVYRVLDELLD